MSKAIKCNRCHTCFDPYETSGKMIRFLNPSVYDCNNLRELTRGIRMFSDVAVDEVIDLCPECAARFQAFMFLGDGTKNTNADME